MAHAPHGLFQLPGYTSQFNMSSNIAGTKNFVWAEALHYEGGNSGYYRRPTDKEVVDNILMHAKRLQEFRDFVGKPFRITSWYRDPETNRRVGGASRSRHMKGLATDIVIADMTGYQVFELVNKFGWVGGIGIYKGFTHLDSRGVRAVWYG